MFTMNRLSAAMLRAAPDHPDRPTGRTLRGTYVGVAIAMVLCVIVAIIGILFPGRVATWRTEGTVVLEEDTGARYLYLGGELRPVLNVATVQLLLGGSRPVETASSAALAGTPRGAPLGITGAPEVLPSPAALSRDPWLSCAVRETSNGKTTAGLALEIGQPSRGTALGHTEGVLVAGGDGALYLLWDGSRHRLDTAHGARQALGYGAAAPRSVTADFLALVPAGVDAAPPDLPGRGNLAAPIAGRPARIGQLYTSGSGAVYVLTVDGLTPLTETARALLLGDPRTQELSYQGATPVVGTVGPQDLSNRLAPERPAPVGALPAVAPRLIDDDPGLAVCVSTGADQDQPVRTLVTVPAASLGGQEGTPQLGVAPGCGLVDRIAVRGGRGVLVSTVPTQGSAAWFLVTDVGVKFPLPAAGPPDAFGYRNLAPARVPAFLVNLLPTGPALDPALFTGKPSTASNPTCA
jgi:type VII secretion protein EccB